MITRTGEGQRPKLGLNWDITPEYFKLVWLWQNPRTCTSTTWYWRLRWKVKDHSGWAWKLFTAKASGIMLKTASLNCFSISTFA